MILFIKDLIKSIFDILDLLKKEKFHRLILSFMIVISAFGLLTFYFEYKEPDSLIRSVSDGIWWSIVTITTVGYGDKYPVTLPGKIAGILIMASGLILTVVISGTIASILVDRKIKEERGLQKINNINHIIICGWNQHGNKILGGFQKVSDRTREKL